jgi:hypothetical protein
VRSDIGLGGTFPDYALPDHTGTVRTLSELQGRDPMILTLARGSYCPKGHRQHLELAQHYPEYRRRLIAAAGSDPHWYAHRHDVGRPDAAHRKRLWILPGQGRALSAIAGPRRSRRPEGSRDHKHMSTNT